MAQVLPSVKTKGVGFAPILKHYFDTCGIVQIIDEHIDLDPRRKTLTHGQACTAMITGILFQVMQLYNLCRLANETQVLSVIFPQIGADQYFDDRLADTLDALSTYGSDNLEMLITQKMIKDFGIVTDVCHNDTTSLSFYGKYDHVPTESPLQITYGFNKKHRDDLKQLVWSMSTSCDHGFPLFQKVYSGNTADVNTYVEQWKNLIDLLGTSDFLYVGDSKLASAENMVHIHENQGFFLAPAPMYESNKLTFFEGLRNHSEEQLLPHKDRLNRGFETPITVADPTDLSKKYTFRMIVLFDHGLFHRKRKTLEQRNNQTRKAFDELATKINRYKLKTQESIDEALTGILNKYQTAEFFSYTIENHPVVKLKNGKRGRPSPDSEKVEHRTDHFKIFLHFDEKALEEALCRIGYYPLITNMTEDRMSITDAMMAHKGQAHHPEHTFRRSKSALDIEPIYLQKPGRIQAFLFLFKIALQVIVLMERTARQNIEKRDKGLDNFRPNRKDVRNPKTEYLLKEFEYVVSGTAELPDGKVYHFVSDLTPLQQEIIEILQVPQSCFTYEYLFGSIDKKS